MGENVKVVIARADAAASAASAARSAYDAKCVRNLVAEVVTELQTIASAIDTLKEVVVALNDRITAIESSPRPGKKSGKN